MTQRIGMNKRGGEREAQSAALRAPVASGYQFKSSGQLMYMTMKHQDAKRVAQEMRTTRGTVVQAALDVCCTRVPRGSGAVRPQTGMTTPIRKPDSRQPAGVQIGQRPV
jgi:hypothetical protein